MSTWTTFWLPAWMKLLTWRTYVLFSGDFGELAWYSTWRNARLELHTWTTWDTECQLMAWLRFPAVWRQFSSFPAHKTPSS